MRLHEGPRLAALQEGEAAVISFPPDRTWTHGVGAAFAVPLPTSHDGRRLRRDPAAGSGRAGSRRTFSSLVARPPLHSQRASRTTRLPIPGRRAGLSWLWRFLHGLLNEVD